ncbi:MAG: hypothetical protein ABIP89_20135 [Polyangiaceae bacterium]
MTPSSLAHAEQPPVLVDEGAVKDVRSEVPNYAYAYTAYGATAKTLGVQAYGLGVATARQRGIVGGGIMVWGSPVDRLTLIGDDQRDLYGSFAPSAAVIVRIVGKNGDGWSLGGLGKFKVEGFGDGKATGAGTAPLKRGEIESEVELGALLSYAKTGGLHFDLDAISGMGTGDDGEVDAEGRLRLGYDLTRMFRLGIDGQIRARLHGPTYLPNGRIWDFAAGPQAILGSKNFFGSVTGGPATMGLVSDRVGWNAIASVGGTTL